MLESIRLYWLLVEARRRGLMQYRASFVIQFLGSIGFVAVDFAAILIIFGRIPNLAGWSAAEVALLFGLSATAFALAELAAAGFDYLPRQLVFGTFDRVLTRPVGTMIQVIAIELPLRKIGKVLQGGLIAIVAAHTLAIEWTPDKLVVLALAIVSGVVIFFAVFVLGAASSFWTIQSNEAVNAFTNGGTTLISYPLDIYDHWLRRFVTFVIPLGFATYYPALYLLERPDPLGLPSWISFLSPLAAIAFGLVAWLGWRAAVRHYQSTGS